MKFVAFAAAAACVAAALGVPSAAAAAAPLSAYGELPTIESITISPDGARLAVAVTTGEQRALQIKTIPDGQTKTYLVGDAKVRELDWVGPDHVIITTSRTGKVRDAIGPRGEYLLGFDLEIATGEVHPLLAERPGRPMIGTHIHSKDSGKVAATLNILAGLPQVRDIEGSPTLFLPGVSFPDRRGVFTFFKADLATGDAHLVEIGDSRTVDMVLGADGAVVAKADYDPDGGVWTLKMRQNGGWKALRTIEAKVDIPKLVGLGRDGRSVLIGERGDLGYVLREVSPEGVWSAPLDAAEADGVVFDPSSFRMIGLHALAQDEDRYTFFDPQDQAAWNTVKGAFKGDRVELESWTADRRKIVVLVDSATLGQAYALVDLDTKRATWLGARYQRLQPEDIGPVRPIRFKARDGLDLTGYLTTPHGKTPKALPLVVFPHGGPAARDRLAFDWWAQAMASRGYAVLQVNFRGSEGFGWPFLQAGFGEWGRKMQTDLSDGVNFLAGEGVIDPKRVCIVGGSYGGYAALAGAAFDGAVYRCAVSVAGPSDLRRFVDWSKSQSGERAFRYWTRFMGAEDSRDPVLAQISPAAHADQIAAPVLLIHGRDDTVVPLEQSEIMAAALRKAGKPAELVMLTGADHWLSRGDTRLQTLEATMAFVEKYNPPD
jgi:dipeptidyl aminopeptidase/acylaminoacyl peptidase